MQRHGQSITDGRLLATDPLEGFGVRHEAGRLRRHLPRHAGDPVAAVAVHHARASTPTRSATRSRSWSARSTLFVLGAGIAYYTLPQALNFLQDIGGDNIVTAYSPSKYFQLITYMMLAFGIGFEFPIVLVFAADGRACSRPTTLRKVRRYAIVGICVLVAVITPSGDPISMLALSVPMVIFYEVSIIIGGVHRAAQEGRSPGMTAGRADRATTSRSTRSSCEPSRPSTRAARCWWRRRPARARRSWPSTRSARRWPRGTRPSTPRRSRRSRTRSTPTCVRRHGADRVGLLTGDNAINGDAPVVVMTTEVLRNMIYAGSPALRRPALRRARRGALPPGRLPGPGVGGGHHPPAAGRRGSCACRPRCRTPRSWPSGSPRSAARPRR